jgi:hypothetical protein
VDRVLWFFRLLDEHHGIVTAFGTLVIAIFTVVLAIATYQLKKLGQKQASDIDRSIAITEKAAVATEQSATAAQVSADAAKQLGSIADRQARIAENALIAEQRPWVSFDLRQITLVSGISYDVVGARFTIRFVLKNTGRTPAAGVWIDAFVYSLGQNAPSPTVKRAELLAEDKKRVSLPPWGVTIFPGDEYEIRQDMYVYKDEVEKVKSSDVKFLAPVIIARVNYYFLLRRAFI